MLLPAVNTELSAGLLKMPATRVAAVFLITVKTVPAVSVPLPAA